MPSKFGGVPLDQETPAPTAAPAAVQPDYTREEIMQELQRRQKPVQMQPQPGPPSPYQEMAADVGPLQSFLIGAGRGFVDVARGVGAMDPEGPSERAAMGALRERNPISTIGGEIVGQSAPFVPLGGVISGGLKTAQAGRTLLPAASNAAARIGIQAAAGAGEAGIIASGTDRDVGWEAGVGAGFGAGAEILFPLIGRAGRRIYQRAFGREPAGAMLDAVGRPTEEFQKALDASGMTFEDMSRQAQQAVQEMAPGTVPEQAIRAARFTGEGVPASLADITRGEMQQATEQRLMGSTLDPAAEPFRQFKLAQSEAIKDNLASAVGEEFAAEETGQLMQSALEGRQSLLRTQKNELYKLARNKADDMGGLPLFTDGIADAVPMDELEDLAITAPGPVDSARTILAKYGVMDPPEEMSGKIDVTPLNLENFERFRKTLNRIERGDPTGAVGVITGPVRRALDQELVEMADSTGGLVSRMGRPGPGKITQFGGGDGAQRVEDIRGLADTLKEARGTVKQIKEEFDPAELVGQLTRPKRRGGVTPFVEASKVYDKVMGKAQPVEQVRKVVASLGKSGELGEQGLAALQSTTMLDLIESGFSTPSRTVGGVPIFNPVAFKRRLKGIGADKVKAVFKNRPDIIKKIDNIDKISSDLIPTDRMVPKGSADTLMDMFNAMGLLTLTAKIPGLGSIAGPMAQQAREAGGRAATRREVSGAINQVSPEVMEEMSRTFPSIRGMLGAAAVPAEMEYRKEKK